MAEESKYAYDEESVKAIIEWVQTARLPKEVALSEAEHIFDTSLYVNANICDIKPVSYTHLTLPTNSLV